MNKELIKKLDQDLKEIFSNVKKIITNAEKEKSKNPFDQFGGQQNLN
jgi:predicted transcriptional regulator